MSYRGILIRGTLNESLSPACRQADTAEYVEMLAKIAYFRKKKLLCYTFEYMVTIFTKDACPACTRTKERLRELAIPYEEKNIGNDSYLGELLRLGGKRQVPFLVDEERGVSMYDSKEIIGYLEQLPV